MFSPHEFVRNEQLDRLMLALESALPPGISRAKLRTALETFAVKPENVSVACYDYAFVFEEGRKQNASFDHNDVMQVLRDLELEADTENINQFEAHVIWSISRHIDSKISTLKKSA